MLLVKEQIWQRTNNKQSIKKRDFNYKGRQSNIKKNNKNKRCISRASFGYNIILAL